MSRTLVNGTLTEDRIPRQIHAIARARIIGHAWAVEAAVIAVGHSVGIYTPFGAVDSDCAALTLMLNWCVIAAANRYTPALAPGLAHACLAHIRVLIVLRLNYELSCARRVNRSDNEHGFEHEYLPLEGRGEYRVPCLNAR